MSSITNVTTGDIEIVDPLAIAYQAAGVDVPVTAADPLPITGTITTTQGPVQYVDAGGADVEVKEGVRPLPVSVEASIDVPMGPIEFKDAANVTTVVKAGDPLTALPINAEGGTIDTVSTVTSVTDVANVQSVDLVDTVTTVGTVTSVTDVANVQDVDSVNLVDLVTTVSTVTSVTDVANVQDVDSVNLVDLVTEVSKVDQSNGYHLDAASAEVATATAVNRGPVTERGIQTRPLKFVALDVGPAAGVGAGGGVVFHTTAGWERISHLGIMNTSAPGEVSLGIVDPGTGMITYSGELRVMASASLPGVASVAPREYTQPFNLAPGTEIAIWHSVFPSNCELNMLVESLE